jgi:hypothetical protein
MLGADGRDFSYLAEYTDLIRKISLSDIQKASELIPLLKLSLAASGTFAAKRTVLSQRVVDTFDK